MKRYSFHMVKDDKIVFNQSDDFITIYTHWLNLINQGFIGHMHDWIVATSMPHSWYGYPSYCERFAE